MNIKKVLQYIGIMMMLEACLMLIPLLCGIIYKEYTCIYFLIVAVPLFVLGILLKSIFTTDISFYSAEGFAIAALGWILLSFFGALPFYLSKEIPNYIDALFETVSGFTTTGATILNDVESLSKCMNLWRAFTHFVGGMGVLVLLLAILPSRSEDMQIMKAESPGPQVGKLVPKVSHTAQVLYIIYVVITIIMIVCYKLSGMTIYDAICIGFGTAGTGGFVVTNAGCSSYSNFTQSLIGFFMLVYGVNFNIYYLILIKKFKYVFKSEELRVYLLIVVSSIILIAFNIMCLFKNFVDALHVSFFQVSSIITTTGFSTFDITEFPVFSQSLLLLLMLFGGCAGSTAGGFKIARLVILFKSIVNEIYLQLHPNSIKVIKFEDKVVSNETIRTVNSYTYIYIIIIIIGTLIISLEDFDYTTTLSSVFETFNNIGIGLSLLGPKGNFSIFNQFSKVVFIFLMLTGRLEIFPMLILFSKKTWRREQ